MKEPMKATKNIYYILKVTCPTLVVSATVTDFTLCHDMQSL